MAEIVLRRATSDGVVSAKPGDTLVVELEENLSTGYSWQIASQPSWCDLIASEHSPATSDLMGASGIHRFRLQSSLFENSAYRAYSLFEDTILIPKSSYSRH